MRSLKIPVIILFISIPQIVISQNINLLSNPGFEIKSVESWSALGSCSYEIYSNAKHSGKNAMAFYPSSEGAGVRCDISSIVQPGYVYAFSGFFKTITAGWGQLDVLLFYQQTGKANQILIGRADTNEKNWTEMSRLISIPTEVDPGSLQLVVKSSWGQIAFLVDDLELRPALQVQVQRAASPTMPDFICQIGPINTDRENIIARAQIFDSQNNLIHQFNSLLFIPTRLTLAPGFYRIHAIVSDLDGRPFVTDKPCYTGNAQELIDNLQKKTDDILVSDALQRYHGWIRYLNFLCSWHLEREGMDADQTIQAYLRLADWIKKITQNPDIFDTFSGVIEWAYQSRVDNSGQPFKIAIPSMYTTVKSYPLVVAMHGYGGNHLEHSNGVQSNPNFFELHVLGRARGGGYTDLSEADVLDAVKYVQKYWNIDPSRILLTGASMGGGGTFNLISRYPQRWAAGWPQCGFGTTVPAANMLHVPIYSIHSQDDPTVPILASRAILQKLAALGGQVIIDETIGLQHSAWNYVEGNNRAQTWALNQIRPDLRDIHCIDYTAQDRLACQAYWLKIKEWGNMPGNARFKATASNNNQLYLQLQNIRSIQIMIPLSPFDPKNDLRISVNTELALILKAPLPDSVYVNFKDNGWIVQTEMPDRPAFILHTPGGAHNLYYNEPLLIVWGTGGDASNKEIMSQVVEASSSSVNMLWIGDDEQERDGVPNNRLLYGHLNAKPDTAVTDDDLQRCHLVLIGTPEENALVRKMQAQLPVQFNAKQIVCSDGVALERSHNMMGLYFYNPLAPHKLIYWVAADKPAAYKTGYSLFQNWSENQFATDFVVVRDDAPTIVTLRHFDSRWNWSGAFEKTAFIPQQDITYEQLYARTAEAMRGISGSDFALYGMLIDSRLDVGIIGVTRWADVAGMDMTTPIAVFQMKGSLILSHQKGFIKNKTALRFYPNPRDVQIDPDKIYQVAMSSAYLRIRELLNQQTHVPAFFVITDDTIFDAMRRYLF